MVHADEVAITVSERTVLVSVMLANNETGSVQPVAAIAEAVRGAREISQAPDRSAHGRRAGRQLA